MDTLRLVLNELRSPKRVNPTREARIKSVAKADWDHRLAALKAQASPLTQTHAYMAAKAHALLNKITASDNAGRRSLGSILKTMRIREPIDPAKRIGARRAASAAVRG